MPRSIGYTIRMCVVLTTLAGCLSPASAFTKVECEYRFNTGVKRCASKSCEVKGSDECQEKSSCFNYNEQRYKNCMRNASDR
jgi:hypothetical protein